MDVNGVAREAGLIFCSAVVGFANGCLAGRNATFPGVFIAGGVIAATYVAERALNLFVAAIAKRYDWQFSTYFWTTFLMGEVLQVAAAVSLFVLGIIDGPGMLTWIVWELFKGTGVGGFNYFMNGKSFDDPYVDVVRSREKMYENAIDYIKDNFLDHDLIKARRCFRNIFCGA